MGGSKNNPNKRLKVEEKVAREPRNYYGFNDTLWMSVTAKDALEAEKLIRAACNLTRNSKLTIKPL